MPELKLVTIPHVHLASVGTWDCSTGKWECTSAKLAAIVAAQDDPGVRSGVIKLGHVDPRFDGQPAVGRIENLSLEDDGMELYGDLVGVPSWLPEVLASAFPSRSVEVIENYAGTTGHTHAAVLTGLALLGVTAPAIGSLEDVAAMYDPEYVELIAAAGAGSTRHVGVFAAVSVDTLRAEFYEKLPAGSWTWIREIYAGSDAYLIVDDDEGDLYKIPWSESDGSITFGAPVRVEVQYVESAESADDDSLLMLARFTTPDPVLVRASQGDTPMPIDPKDLLAVVGLPETATAEEYQARLDELATLAAPPTPEPDVKPTPLAELPEGSVVLDEAQVAELVSAARSGAEAHAILAAQDRDRVLDAAVRAGKFPPARRAHYIAMWEKDPDGTREHVEKTLAAGLIPVGDHEHGNALASEAMSDDAIWAALGLESDSTQGA